MSASKLLLSYLREGDFAHPGDLEAVDLTMALVSKQPERQLLDVGCGLGGTANYLQQQGFGQVSGIDVDPEVLSYARAHYPACRFQEVDATQREALDFPQPFQLICFFSSFFSIFPQQACLANMWQISEKKAELVIFDYSRLQAEPVENPFPWSKNVKHCQPLYLPLFEKELEACGWQLKASLDLSQHFERWYQHLLQRFKSKAAELKEKFGPELPDKMYQGYARLLQLLQEKKFGGLALCASKID